MLDVRAEKPPVSCQDFKDSWLDRYSSSSASRYVGSGTTALRVGISCFHLSMLRSFFTHLLGTITYVSQVVYAAPSFRIGDEDQLQAVTSISWHPI